MENQNIKWLNAKQLRAYLGGISQATLWRYYKRDGKLPQPKRLSKSILLWNLDEVNAKLGLVTEQGGEK
ncbi:MAG: AlpA family transcriptional regulator [Campylobacter sp.]|nr:AlpA family transcriptional regulator [Campylobacter sp.]